MTASTYSDPAAEPAERPRAPIAAAVVVVAALHTGAGAVAVSSVLSSDLVRVLIALVLLLGGWWVSRRARDRHNPATLAIGSHVLRGVGTSYVVLGAYLAGFALLTSSIPDVPVFSSEDAGPSPTATVLMVYGLPAIALLAVATTGMRAWTAGAGAILPMIAVLLLANGGASAATVSVTMLVVGLVLAVVVVRAPGGAAWGNLASAAAAMATSFAFGAGTSPFGTLGATQLAGAAGSSPSGTLGAGALIAVLAGALLVAAILLLTAVARRDLAGGVLVAAIFTMPPVFLSTWLPPQSRWPTEAMVALAGAPALVALVAMAAIRSRRIRDALIAALPAPAPRPAKPPITIDPPVDGDQPPDTDPTAPPSGAHPADSPPPPDFEPAGSDQTQRPTPYPRTPRRPSSAIAAAACAVIVATAAVVFVVLALPVFGWDMRAQGAVALLVLVGAAALAYWLPATPGAAGAIVALLGLGLASPWGRLLGGDWASASQADRIIIGVLEIGVAVALAVVLTRRHPRPGVYAAAAYTLAGSLAAFLGALLFDPVDLGPSDRNDDFVAIVILVLPLLLLGLAAAVALLRGRIAIGQAVGAVVFAAAGFLPLKVLAGAFSDGGVDGFALQFALTPLTPTDWLGLSVAFDDGTGPTLVAALVMVLLALAMATSLATRPHAPLAGAVALLLLAAVQTSLLTVLDASSAEDAALLGQVLGGLSALTAVIAVATAANAARRG
ncbi:MAG: hypothetical protein ACRDSK_16240 [Actinophytocola sp.]|uniref:hypothetical protein n=1 Tax=Actinophytocola sp. TaxID=1872138 RepID=UPI003D6C26F8